MAITAIIKWIPHNKQLIDFEDCRDGIHNPLFFNDLKQFYHQNSMYAIYHFYISIFIQVSRRILTSFQCIMSLQMKKKKSVLDDDKTYFSGYRHNDLEQYRRGYPVSSSLLIFLYTVDWGTCFLWVKISLFSNQTLFCGHLVLSYRYLFINTWVKNLLLI